MGALDTQELLLLVVCSWMETLSAPFNGWQSLETQL